MSEATVQQEAEATVTHEQRLRQLSERTNDDGTIDVTLTDWEPPSNPDKQDATATVHFSVVGESHSIEVDYPRTGDNLASNEFNRLLHAAGLSMDMPDFEHASDVPAYRNDDGSWEFVLPSRVDASFLSRARPTLPTSDVENPSHPTSVGSVLLFVVLYPLLFPAAANDDKFGRAEWSIAGMFALGTVLWGGAAILGLLALGVI